MFSSFSSLLFTLPLSQKTNNKWEEQRFFFLSRVEVLPVPSWCPLERTEWLFFLGGLIVITVLSIVFAPFTLDSMSEPATVCNHYSSIL